MHEEIFRKKCESASDKLHSALYNFTVICSSHIKWISGFILCTLYSSDHCMVFTLKKTRGVRKEMVVT